jgi:glucan biosynthesis protein C
MYLLSDASYSIYLFHQVLVIGFGLLLIRFEIGGLGGLIFLMVLVAIVSLAIHIIFISKIPLLRLLFNGKKDLGP